jgi:hypothetical protein
MKSPFFPFDDASPSFGFVWKLNTPKFDGLSRFIIIFPIKRQFEGIPKKSDKPKHQVVGLYIPMLSHYNSHEIPWWLHRLQEPKPEGPEAVHYEEPSVATLEMNMAEDGGCWWKKPDGVSNPWGYPKLAGWLISWKIPPKNGWFRGTQF